MSSVVASPLARSIPCVITMTRETPGEIERDMIETHTHKHRGKVGWMIRYGVHNWALL